MKFVEFKESIQQELLAHPSGFTWVELRDRLSLPYTHPCQNWITRLEQEIGLVRKERIQGAYVWKIKPSKECSMKLLIACDMEGISGVVSWDQVDPSKPEYQRFRHIITADVNAAVAGACAGGSKEIVIADGHWNSSNVLLDELDPRAHLNTGTPTRLSMVQGADSGVDAAIFLGYHARAGSLHAVLDHTWSSVRVANLWLNGRITGEFGLNGAICGELGIPVIMVSGDQTVCAEAREWAPGVTAAQVKTAAGRYAAHCLPFEVSRKLIEDTAREAVSSFLAKKHPAPIKIKTPVTVTIEFFHSHMADQASLLPGASRLDGRRIEFKAGSMVDAYLGFRAAVNMVTA